MKITKYALAIVFSSIILVASTAVRASADSFNFAISGSGITASGTLTANPEVNGTFLVTGLSGTQNGQSMTLLAPNGFAGNDNLLYAASPLLDFSGLSYEVAGVDYNLQYDSPGDPAPFVGYGDFNGTSGAWLPVNFSAPVPEPSSLLLLATGLLALGLLARRRVLAA